jgi:4-hydroxybenzoate polyprenyltransferase
LGLVVIVAYIVGGDVGAVEGSLAGAFFALCCCISGGYVLNDVCDVAVDAINCPGRMMTAGRVGKRAGVALAVCLFAGGLVIGSFCGGAFFLVLCMISAGLVFYDIYSKRIGIFKDVLVAVLVTSLYPLAFTLARPAQTGVLKSLYIFPVWLFLSAFGYEMLKDIRDIEGDRLGTGKLLQSYGGGRGFEVAARIIIVGASVISVLPFLLGYCKFIYMGCSVVAVLLALFSLRYRPGVAIRFIYAEIFLIAGGSMVDLLVFGG